MRVIESASGLRAWRCFSNIHSPAPGLAPSLLVSGCRIAAAAPDGYQAASGFVPVVHNVYLELLAEYGLPGFLAYAIVTSWLVGQLTSLAIFGSDAQSTDDSDDARRWAVALLISWSSMLVMAMFDLSFTSFRFTYVYWMIVGLSFSIII